MASDYSLFLLLLLAVSSSSAFIVSADTPDISGLLNSLSQGNVASLHDTMQCMQKLMPCKPYLNASATDSPPESCCSSLEEIVDTNFECLCRFYNDPQILSTLNVTRDDALQLPRSCNVRLRLSKCKHEASPPSSSVTPSIPTDPAATQAAAAAVLEAAQKSMGGANGGKDEAAASSSGLTNRISYLGVVLLVASASLFIH